MTKKTTEDPPIRLSDTPKGEVVRGGKRAVFASFFRKENACLLEM